MADGEETMKVYLEIPDGWIDAESPILWASITVKQQAERYIREEVIRQYVEKTPLPEIKPITEQEVRSEIIHQMAEKALESAKIE